MNNPQWKIMTSLLFMLCICIGGCVKREAIKKDNNFTVMPLPLILSTNINLSYTRTFIDNLSGTLMFGYKPPVGIAGAPVHAIGAEFDLYYWSRYVNDGFFVGPYLQVSKVFDNKSEGYVGGTGLIPGVGIGYRWLWDYGFNIGLGASVGYAFAVQKPNCPIGYTCTNSSSISALGNWAPRLLFDLGYAF